MARVVVLLHVRDEDAARYRGAGPVRAFWIGSGSGAYLELVARYPTLRGFLQAEVPQWRPGVELVLGAHSAGGWAVESWMRSDADRRLVSALLLLDCLYDSCAGAVAYAELCRAEAWRTLVVTYGPYTEGCAAQVQRLGESASTFVFAPAVSHRSHASEVGPEALRQIVAPRLSPTLGESAVTLAALLGLTVAAGSLR